MTDMLSWLINHTLDYPISFVWTFFWVGALNLIKQVNSSGCSLLA